jgi:predicted phage terminase large subunit-like protein
MCVSYNAELANNLHGYFLRLVQSPWYQNAFQPRIARAVMDSYETEDGGRRYAMSVDGKITGYSADLIIIDDPLNANDAFSKPERDRVNNFATGALFSRLSNKMEGQIILVMQRLHAEDLSGYLLARGDGDWEHLCLPGIAPGDRLIQLPYSKTYSWKEGEALHPEFCDLKILDRIKRQMGTMPFNAQYLQEPMPAGESLLKPQYLRTYEAAPLRGPSDIIVQSWDTAVKDTPTSDYSVGLTLLARGKQVFLLDVYRRRVEFPDLRRDTISLASKYQPDFILVEESANGSPLLQELRKQSWRMIGVTPDTAKEARVARHTATLEADPLYLPQYAAWLDDFRSEFLAFPQTRHDDQVDALAQFCWWYEGYQSRTQFSCDMGFAGPSGSAHTARLAAPSPSEVLGLLGR